MSKPYLLNTKAKDKELGHSQFVFRDPMHPVLIIFLYLTKFFSLIRAKKNVTTTKGINAM